MDNALASKDALRLSLGVSLTGQQVGALTHDIVWMENRVIDGQTVLVPVLYLAQADSRNVRGNSLIQGRDLNLVTGGDLINVGTLRASNNLSAISSGSIYTGGLVEAGNNLNLLAQDSIRNAMAGEIRGKQVSLTALKGDFINDNTAIQVRDGAGMRTLTDTSAGTIVARENLAINAGRDLTNRGALTAGNDANLTAGRDLNLIAASDTRVKHEFSDGGHKSSITTDVKNLAASVTAGGSINMQAGQDVNIIGSNATAGKDLNIAAGRDVNVASVSDMHNVEGKEKHGKKRIKTSDDQTTQVASVLTAGGDFVSQAGRDTTIVASRISAGDEAYLYSGDKLSLLAAQNSTHTLYDMKKKGSWGAKKAQMDEVTRTTQVGTEIKTGGNLVLKSEGDQLYQVAKLNSGKDIILDSNGAIVFEGVKDLHDESHTKSKSDLSWFSAKGKGNTDETLRQSELVAQGQLVIKAAEGIRIDVKQVDQQTVSQTVDAMVKADPKLAWLKQAEARGDIDWRQVKEIHESFKYDNSGLGAGAKIAIAIMMAAIMGPAGFGLGGWQLAVATSFSTTGVTSTINNKGNLGAALKETASANSLKSAAVAGFTAGALEYADTNWFAGADGAGAGTTTVQGVTPSTGSTLAVTNSSKDIFTWTSAGDIALRTGGRAVISSGISTAVQGGSFGDNFNAALLGEAGNVAMATGFNWVGDYVTFPNGSPQKIIAHALMGGLLAQATGSDFKTGAAAAGLNEALINQLAWAAQDNKDIMLMLSQLTGLVAAAAVDGDLEKGAQVAQKATTFNYLTHQKFDEVRDCISGRTCSTDAEKIAAKTEAERLSKFLDDEMNDICSKNPGSDSCRTAVSSAIKYTAIKDAWNVMHGDVERSSKNTFDYLYNTEEGKGSFVSYFNTIDNRANFFSASDTYEHQLGIGAKWFGGADTVSRAPITGLGADGNASYLTFGAGWALAPVYDWRKAAGDALMAGGYDNFKALYDKKTTDPVAWDINQLKNEQATLQPIHEAYLQDHKRFVELTKEATSVDGFMKYIPFVENQRIEGGVDILDYKSRVKFGCKLLGYSASQGCAP